MHKINDIIFLYPKKVNKSKIKDTDFNLNKFAKIINIREVEDGSIDYIINLLQDPNKKNIVINNVTNILTFCNINELDIPNDIKSFIDNVEKNQ